MFRPVELFVGMRYVRAGRRTRFVSFITLVSFLGVAVGVAALIVVRSVMNGFENELRHRLLSMTSHAVISDEDGRLADWPAVLDFAGGAEGVAGAAPFIEVQAMLGHGSSLKGAQVRGIRPNMEGQVSRIGNHMIVGSVADLVPGDRNIVLGRLLAARLGVWAGDAVTVMVPQAGTGRGIVPRLSRYTVSGVFEVGMQEHDGVLALTHLEDAAALKGFGDTVSGVRLAFTDLFAAPLGAQAIASDLGPEYRVRDWTQENQTYFRAVRIEKTMMSIILFLVVGVAAFNIVATLVMVVTDKRTEIAILRTLGLPRAGIMNVFLVQGSVIGVIGTLLGAALGVLLAANVETLAPQIEALLGVTFMDPEVYYISRLPSDLRQVDVMWITGIALVLWLLATVYPARRAAATPPAEALRYE